MSKSNVESLFSWWFSIHPMNVRMFENWIGLSKCKKEEI